MGKYCKFENEVYQVSYDSGVTFVDVTPRQTRNGDLLEINSNYCGYEIEPQYRWYRAPASDFLCDDCPESIERWVNIGSTFCIGKNKYVFQGKEVSYDSGTTWSEPTNVKMTLVEAKSADCGYVPITGDYLTFEAVQSNSIGFSQNIYYSRDEGETWYELESTYTLHLDAGDKVCFKKITNPSYSAGHFRLTGTGYVNVSGNIMSLAFGDEFDDKTSLEGYYHVFEGLFSNMGHLRSAENLVLPATTLENLCYNRLFMGCSGLTTAPKILPAPTVSYSGYSNMFSGCTALTTAPELPATTLGAQCYYGMFNGCTSLTTAPDLLVTNLRYADCYAYMFYGCTSLNYIRCLASSPSSAYTKYWVYNVSPSGVFAKNENATWSVGIHGIPSGWTTNEKWVDSGYTCSGESGYDKYVLQVKEVTSDGGETWSATSETRLGDLIHRDSVDCGYDPTPVDYHDEYLTFKPKEDCTFRFSAVSTTYTVSYSVNNGETWVALENNTDTPTISAGQRIMWKSTLWSQTNKGIGRFSSTGRFIAEGNAMSMLYGNNFKQNTSLKDSYDFYGLFSGCTGITNAENLVLPAGNLSGKTMCYLGMFANCSNLLTAPVLSATTLSNYCYAYMFSGCTSLTTAPELPATTLEKWCYQNMFSSCSSLTTAPVLSATTLASMCYYGMFSSCSGLTTPPELPATNLSGASSCYDGMFSRCTSLTTAPQLSATTLADNCYQGMFQGCASLTTAPELPATTLKNGCYSGMFWGCASLTTAPSVLPATNLSNASSCYCSMFENCSGLTTAPVISATTFSTNAYSYSCAWMFRGCSSLTAAPELHATTIGGYCYAGMFDSCTSLTTAPVISATTLGQYCCDGMFSRCTSLTTAPSILPATTLASYCYRDMFNDCTSLTTAPELPAINLRDYCYYQMFKWCSRLNYIKAMFTTAPSSSYLGEWVRGVASSGTFVMNSAASWITGTPCGISTYPCNWTIETA